MSIKYYQEDHPVYAPNTFPLLYLTVLVLLGWSIIIVVKGMVESVHQARELAKQSSAIDQAKLEVELAKRFIVYQQTSNYVEKQAREHFAYIKPGETAVDLPENSDQSQALENEIAGRDARANERVTQTHLQEWWQYFFGR